MKAREVIVSEDYFEDFLSFETLERILSMLFEDLTGTNGLYEARDQLGLTSKCFCVIGEKIVVLMNGVPKENAKRPENKTTEVR